MQKITTVSRKPHKCPHCGGEICEILYGEPMCSEEEYYERYGKHVIFGGCCITGDDPEWACLDCRKKFKIKRQKQIDN